MKRAAHLIIFFMAGLFLYYAWTGFVNNELTFTTHKGSILEKYETTDILESGINVMSHPVYHIKLSTGARLQVSAFVYNTLKTGDSAVFAEKQNHVYLIGENKLIY
ncbi:hypothetical protein [Metabacillus idriensis]|uniref:hypothetical protein n=1 Tax=Metabacillus idriensis TaxID=324768 RepID=UPI003D27419B